MDTRLLLPLAERWSRRAEAGPCRDPVRASQLLRGVYSEHRMRVLGPDDAFGMAFLTRALGPVEVGLLGFGTEVELAQEAASHFTLVSTQLRGRACIRRRDRERSGGEGMVVLDAAHEPVLKRFSADSWRLNLRIDQAALTAKQVAWCGTSALGREAWVDMLRPGTEVHQRWLAWLNFLLTCLTTEASSALQGASGHGQSWADPVVEAGLLLLLQGAQSEPEILSWRQTELAPRHVRRAEEYIRAHAQEPLTLEDMARAAGVSIRTLTDGFRRARDTTPMALLREQRLLGARQDLLQAGPERTVTQVAMQWGFLNVGRFSAQYAVRFGERPGETLRRPA